MTNLTANEKELLEMIHNAENPEEAAVKAIELLTKFLDKDSKTNKIIGLMTEKYSTIADFAKAVNMSEETATDIISGELEPTLDEVRIIAAALDREPEAIAQIFIDHYGK